MRAKLTVRATRFGVHVRGAEASDGMSWGGSGFRLLPASDPGTLSPRCEGMEVHLIAEVSKWPILYDTSLEEYKHVELKNQAWRHITYALFNSTNTFIIEKVKNKWKNLRDTFVKAQRKKDKPNSKPWKLEAEMNFLIPHINPKFAQGSNGEGNHSPVERYITSSPEQYNKESLLENLLLRKKEDEESIDDGMVMQHVETVMEDSPKVVRRKRRKDSFNVDPSQHFLDMSDHSVKLEQVQSNYDAIDCYFLGLAQTVKRLKPINQVLLKKAISNLVFDAELKETEAVCEATSSS